MKKTLLTVIATTALTSVLLADTKETSVAATETPRGGNYEMRFSKNEESLGSFIKTKVLFSLPGSKDGKIHHSRSALLVENRYVVFLDNSSTSGVHWQGKNKEMPIFLTHPEGKKIQTKKNSVLQHLILNESSKDSPENIVIVPFSRGIKVNGITGNSGLNLATGIAQHMVVAQTSGETDRIFWGLNGKPVTASSSHWAIDAHRAIIREYEEGNTQLVAIGNTETSRSRVATRFVSLEIEGQNAGIEGIIPRSLKDSSSKIEVAEMTGHYFAEKGGTLRLQFGLPTQTSKQKDTRLLAFWKFDEGNGAKCVDLKDPENKSTIIDINTKKAWVKGVGFGKASAVNLDSAAHIQTSFSQELQGNNSIALWIKTTSGGQLLSKVALKSGQLLPGSRMIQVTPSGKIKLTVLNSKEETILSEAKVNDGKWHHIAWTVTEQDDEGMRTKLNTQHRLYINSKLQGQLELKRPHDLKPINSPLVIGKEIIYKKDKKNVAITGFNGVVDNLRIYNFPLNEKQISGFYMVGRKISPFVITSTPKKTIHVGERFNYAVKFTGVPSASFKLNTLPEWIKFE